MRILMKKKIEKKEPVCLMVCPFNGSINGFVINLVECKHVAIKCAQHNK